MAAKLFDVIKPESYDPTKLAIVDFRADWCAACLELEHKTFATSQVADVIKAHDFQFISVDLTHEEHPWAKKYGVVSLPTVLILKPQGLKCETLSLFEFEDAEAFVERLKRALVDCQ
jgi:thiol:disulfide interchange protein DsbD